MTTYDTKYADREQEMVGGGISLNLNPKKFIQDNLYDEVGPSSVHAFPENASLVAYPRAIAPPPIVMTLDKDRMRQVLQIMNTIQSVEIDCEWPQNLSEAMPSASCEMLAILWDTPEEDEAWQDL